MLDSLISGLTDEELRGLLQVASTIYEESPVDINVKKGTIKVGDPSFHYEDSN